MKLYILILSLAFSSSTFGQKKKECDEKLNSKIININGLWKLAFCELDANTGIEKRKCPDHLLFIDKSKFYSNRHKDSIPHQTGFVRIKKDNPAKYGNCAVLLYFKSKGEDQLYAWDLDTYYQFWLIDKCDADSLVLYSPWTPDLIDKKNGSVIRHYVRQK